MEVDKSIWVEVAYANLSEQKILKVFVQAGVTIREAILQSEILKFFPEIDLETQKVGIFSKVKSLEDIVQEGDRIEIYRSLSIDPKEARRGRALTIKKMRNNGCPPARK